MDQDLCHYFHFIATPDVAIGLLAPNDRDVRTWSSFSAERIINQIVDMHPTGRFITYNEK